MMDQEDIEKRKKKQRIEKAKRIVHKILKIIAIVSVVILAILITAALLNPSDKIDNYSEACKKVNMTCDREDTPCLYSCECHRYCRMVNRAYYDYNYSIDKCLCIRNNEIVARRW